MVVLVRADSVLALTARDHSRAHQPLIRRHRVCCRACDDIWPCDVRAVAEAVLVAAGINPRAYDDTPPMPHRRPSPRRVGLVAR
jgi:hypothetical protein